MSALLAYRQHVDNLAKERNGTPIFNGSMEHAAIIVEKMFAHANHSIDILSGKFNARVYGPEEVVEQSRLFLADPAHQVRILLESGNDHDIKDHPFFSEFWKNSNLQVKRLSEGVQKRYNFHFLVMDDDSYRFESDKTKQAAIAAFGDKNGASNIKRIFGMLWQTENAIQIDLPQLFTPTPIAEHVQSIV